MTTTNDMTTGGRGRASGEPLATQSWGVAYAPPQPPPIQLIGDLDHPDFRDALKLLHADARLLSGRESTPELIVVAQSRPDVFCSHQLIAFQRTAPLAGIVTLLGSWCEGETRTGCPWPGAQRCYWYEFPAWWRRQLALRLTGRCPDWARPANFLPRVAVPGHPRSRFGVFVLHTARRDNADALADSLKHAGFSSIWQRPDQPRPLIRGAVAGIWDGAQLNEREADDLARFCKQMARDGAPVIALLDFPRRDRVDFAYQIGATAVLGKPWSNYGLWTTLESITTQSQPARAA